MPMPILITSIMETLVIKRKNDFMLIINFIQTQMCVMLKEEIEYFITFYLDVCLCLLYRKNCFSLGKSNVVSIARTHKKIPPYTEKSF